MRLRDYLDKDLVLPDMTARNREEALAALVAAAKRKCPQLDVEETLWLVGERELIGSTGVGCGVSIPHAKLSTCSDILIVVGRSLSGVPCESIDDEPCRIFFLVLSPSTAGVRHLTLLGHIASLLQGQALRQRFLRADGLEGLWNLLSML